MRQQLRRPAQFADQFGEVSQLTQVRVCEYVCLQRTRSGGVHELLYLSRSEKGFR